MSPSLLTCLILYHTHMWILFLFLFLLSKFFEMEFHSRVKIELVLKKTQISIFKSEISLFRVFTLKVSFYSKSF